jgi:NADPH:quinone reductase-like Zn-dependent oxidoreductase
MADCYQCRLGEYHVCANEKIIGVSTDGCFAEYVAVDSALATGIPQHLSWEEAAAVPTAFVTAWEALVQYGRLKAGETVLIAGASSGVGVCAIQLGKVLGAKTIGVSGSADKLGKLQALGLDAGIAARGEDFSARALAIHSVAGCGKRWESCRVSSSAVTAEAPIR